MLDQVVFQQKGILLRIDDSELNMTDALYKLMGLVISKSFIEVRTDPFPEVLSLAYIQQLTLFIVLLVNTRLGRYGIGYLLKVF